MKFHKVRFSNGDRHTAGLIFTDSQLANKSISEISRSFPMREASKMRIFEMSPAFDEFDDAFNFVFEDF